MAEHEGKFRFTYFTDKYEETCDFYKSKLGFNMEHSWDRNEHDKGALYKAGVGLIEVMHLPNDEENRYEGLDYRMPQGVFMCIQVWNIDELYKKYKAMVFHSNKRSWISLGATGVFLFWNQMILFCFSFRNSLIL